MAANINPIFVIRGAIPIAAVVTAANTAQDGTGTVTLIEQAGTDGAFIQAIRFKSRAANTNSLARIFVNNGSDPTVAANNLLWTEVLLPATTLSQLAPQQPIVEPMNIILPGAYRIYWALATPVAGGWQASVVAGDYS